MRAQDAVRKLNSSVDVKDGNLRSASRSTAMAVTDLAAQTTSSTPSSIRCTARPVRWPLIPPLWAMPSVRPGSTA